jgi:hypothetical protein
VLSLPDAGNDNTTSYLVLSVWGRRGSADRKIAGMATSLRTRTRATAVLAVSVALTAAATVPAWAAEHRDDGDMPGDTMSWGQAILLFAVIPLAFSALVWLLVSAPGWTRGGRVNAADGWTSAPLVLDSPSGDAGGPADGTIEPVDDVVPALETGTPHSAGGTSARW